MPSTEAQHLWEEFRQARDQSETFDLMQERERISTVGELIPSPPGVTYSKGTIADVPVVWVLPEEPRVAAVVMWIHGGAFTLMSAATHQHFVGHLAAESRLEIVIPDYSLAPECPFPQALEEVVAVYDSLLDQRRADHEAVFVVGDSAGGALAVGVQLTARDQSSVQPALTVLLCPWLDLTLSQKSLISNTENDVVLDASTLPIHAAAYLNGTDSDHPFASPMHASLAGLGPLYIQAAEYDILIDDSHEFARRAKHAGLDVELEIAPELPHSYQFFAGVIPEADAAMSRISAKLCERMSPSRFLG